jgi:hypothetical protein
MAANCGFEPRYTLQITGHVWFQLTTNGTHCAES